jgi:hypothetical protein
MSADRYLRFDVRRPPGGRPFLWPVRVTKVLYPTKRTVRVNLFQQAILGLARARCLDGQEIATLLGLDRELVLFIIATQLIPNGWMTTQGITPRGENILEESEDTFDEIRIGYAYQDSISGNWLPRFTEELPEIEPRRHDESGFPVFLRSLDSGKEDRPYRLSHTRDAAMELGALFDAFERYRTDHAHAKERDQSEDLPRRLRIESLSFVEAIPQPMWLWTWVFPDAGASQPWLISDPFGLQLAASWLRKPLQEILPRNDGAARYIANSLDKSASTNTAPAEWLRSLENQVDLELLADYNWSRNFPIIEGYLASVLRKTALLSSLDKPWQEDISGLLNEVNKLVESVLQWLLKAYPPDVRRLPYWKDQKDWRDGEAMYYLRAMAVSGFTDDVIKKLSGQTLDQVRTAVRKGSSSVKALLFAALLATVDHRDHPFFSLSSDQLRLNMVLEMTDARNKKGSHSGVDRISKDDAMNYAEFVVDWVQIYKEWY